MRRGVDSIYRESNPSEIPLSTETVVLRLISPTWWSLSSDADC